MVFCKKGVLTNFEKFTGKHLPLSLVFNVATDLQRLTLSEKKIPAQIFSCEFCEMSHNTIFKGPKNLSIFKNSGIVDVRPGSKYSSLSSTKRCSKVKN